MKLKSFGCSFVYGSELSDVFLADDDHMVEPSNLTWPAQMARLSGLTYECHAWPGVGNFRILCDVIREASLRDPAIFVINWTWMDRFDFVNDQEQWQTVIPGQRCDRSEAYFRHFHSHIKDMMTSIYNIHTAITMLQQQHVPFVMTYMDHNILSVLDPNYHDPRYLSVMQQKIRPLLMDFEGKNFLDWSRDQRFDISDAWHPLEQAHAAAAKFMLPTIDAILHRA